MKHLITLYLALFFMAGTQHTQAQTKEQTIAWIKEKLEKHGGHEYSSYINVKVSPCHISFTQKYPDGSEYLNSFNPSTAKSWIFSCCSDPGIVADAEIIRRVISNGDILNISKFVIRNGESDIHERMIKALLHLATFCEEGKNEAF